MDHSQMCNLIPKKEELKEQFQKETFDGQRSAENKQLAREY